tara:strand:- start:7733 stop:8260 length:528 start_codon:yes stop_codon:yes gene_type:complete
MRVLVETGRGLDGSQGTEVAHLVRRHGGEVVGNVRTIHQAVNLMAEGEADAVAIVVRGNGDHSVMLLCSPDHVQSTMPVDSLRQTPMGTRRVDGKLVRDPDEETMLGLAKKLALEVGDDGYGHRWVEIAETLGGMGFKTRTGKAPNSSNVRRWATTHFPEALKVKRKVGRRKHEL